MTLYIWHQRLDSWKKEFIIWTLFRIKFSTLQIALSKPGMVEHDWNSATREEEAEGLKFEASLKLLR
jgi:hypothetical protein